MSLSRYFSIDASQVVSGILSLARLPAHEASHDPAGSDPLSWSVDPFHPKARNLLALSLPPEVCNNNVSLTNQLPQLIKLNLPTGPTTINNVLLDIATAAVTLVAGHNYLGLYDSTGALLWSTASTAMDTVFNSGGVKTISTGGIVTSSPFVWLAVLQDATTPLSLFCTSASNTGITNLGTVAATSVAGTLAAAQLVLPASFVPSTITPTGRVYCAALT